MKKIIIIMFLISIVAAPVLSQEKAPDSKPDKELTCDEAALRIQDFQSKVNDLQGKLDALKGECNSAVTKIESAKKALADCKDAIKNLIGATDQDIETFRQKLGVIEGKIRSMSKLSDDELADRRNEIQALENELNEMRQNKISLFPEFYNKIIQLARDIKGLYREKKIKSYTVGTWAEDRDCLWNIAGKIEIYGDPFLWPKIWQANTNIIRNPDIIHPGQVLLLPAKGPKNPEEMKAERKYWRQKREAAESSEKGEPTSGQ